MSFIHILLFVSHSRYILSNWTCHLGLKAQHVAAIQWLAEATEAKVDGLTVGSQYLEFRPSLPPTALKRRQFDIVAGNSASSTLLIFQAIFPFLLFAGNKDGETIELEIHGGTNTSFSPSYEYMDQVLLPTLHDKFGISVERKLKKRSWAIGPLSRGSIWLKFQPLPPGQPLKLQQSWNRPITDEDFKIKRIDVTILVPLALQELLVTALSNDLDQSFPNVDVNFAFTEASGHDARMYTLLVAHSNTGLRWGRDYLYDRAWKKRTPETISADISQKVCRDLLEEIAARGVVDEHLQDQLVVFQALSDGRTTFYRGAKPVETDIVDGVDEVDAALKDLQLEKTWKKDKTEDPFGEGSTHTTTVRWVASKLLPTVQWFNKGTICDGAGVSFPSPPQ